MRQRRRGAFPGAWFLRGFQENGANGEIFYRPLQGKITEDLSQSSGVEDQFVDVFVGFRQLVLNSSNDRATLSLRHKLCRSLLDPRQELPDSPLRRLR